MKANAKTTQILGSNFDHKFTWKRLLNICLEFRLRFTDRNQKGSKDTDRWVLSVIHVLIERGTERLGLVFACACAKEDHEPYT